MSKLSEYDRSANDLSPAFNLYAGRDTSRYAITEFDPSRTQQEFAAESDINNIMARYLKTGTVPMFVDRMMLNGDQHQMTFHEMQNVIASATSSFMQLPSAIRAEFDNDAAKFVDFASDEKNVAKLREWGLLSPEAVLRLDKEAADSAAAEAARASADALGGHPTPPRAASKSPKGDHTVDPS